ncbi:MAG: type II toxin-antitoxin system RelE/ParE family toxin [Planctomycetes bacterium]|nr:type II toxin-antitoxin system RelE/ParE family toxin [Planctomycetota bacterium]
MPLHRVELAPRVLRELRRIDAGPRRRIDVAISALAVNPRPRGCRKLSSSEQYRIRVGDYRVLYEIEDDVLRVLVVKVGHRRDVYE